MANYCYYEGRRVTPEMGGFCNHCSLYMETCAPSISNGYLMGAECDAYFCECCTIGYGCMSGGCERKEAV